jgi:alkanesulfonate monooxygenase SsuD/methylene tetrahydromethanopterin reductase-like flavin-dependent oxidoreductase (luciferase family)
MKTGIVIMLAENDEIGRAPRYRELRAMAIKAEKVGFDSVWLYDHLLYRPEGRRTIGIWECWTMLSALAEATRRVELGTLVACNSFRNPAILAKMAITLDEVSRGRVILGVGAGWNKPEYDAFGMPFDHKVDRFEEALQIIKPLLHEGRVDFQGKYYQIHDCEIAPRGPRFEGPPLLVGSFGDRMLRLTAQYADMWNTAYLGGPDTLVKPREALLAACRDVGRDPATLGVTALVALVYPDLAGKPEFVETPLIGTDQEIAAAMRGYEQMGVSYLIFHIVPFNPTALRRSASALQIYHQNF